MSMQSEFKRLLRNHMVGSTDETERLLTDLVEAEGFKKQQMARQALKRLIQLAFKEGFASGVHNAHLALESELRTVMSVDVHDISLPGEPWTE